MVEVKRKEYRRRPATDTACIFIHGFGGDAQKTWGRFPAFVCEEKALDEWDVHSLGYSTSLAPDIRNLWAADPALPTLGAYSIARILDDEALRAKLDELFRGAP